MLALVKDECVTIVDSLSAILAGRARRNPGLIVRVGAFANHTGVLPIVSGAIAAARWTRGC